MHMIDLPPDLADVVEEQLSKTNAEQRQAAFGTKAPVWQAYSDDQHLIIVFGPKAALLEARRFNREYGTPLPGLRIVSSSDSRGSIHIDGHVRNLLVTGAGSVMNGPSGSFSVEPDGAFALQGIRVTGGKPGKYRIRTAFVTSFSDELQFETLADYMKLTLENAFAAEAETERDQG